MIFVIPTFEDLFKSFGADLPAFTLLIIEVSRFFQEWWWAIFGVLIGAGVGRFLVQQLAQPSEALLQKLALLPR